MPFFLPFVVIAGGERDLRRPFLNRAPNATALRKEVLIYETFLIFFFGLVKKDAPRAREQAKFLRRREFSHVAVGTSNISKKIRDI